MSVTVDTSRGGFASFLMMKAMPIARLPLEVVLNWRGMIGQRAVVATEH